MLIQCPFVRGHGADTRTTTLTVNRITETFVKSAVLPSKGNRIDYDAELKGFGLRVTAAGAKAFVLNYRIAGRERRITLGSYPEWSATAARKEVEALKRRIDLGHDPMAARVHDRGSPSIADLCDLYRQRHLPKKRSQRDDLSAISNIIVPQLGKTKVDQLRYEDVDAIHRAISRSAPFRANRVVALLSKMLSLAVKWDYRADNPAKGIERNPENHRSRYLSRAELSRLAVALDGYSNQNVANAIRLLLLTGARRMEVLSARWDQFELQSGVWTKPKENVKQKREHRIPLSGPALRLLLAMRGNAITPFLFPARDGDKHLSDIKKAWATICRKASIDDCRLHDLRHTYASYLASSGFSLPIVGALLGHSQAQTTQRYVT